ncbi:hypothetical protein M9H77_21561 [Catharanthus roseus]|uniref:Uncharacterized protein n=1 Tax=Catharanthus roseus TaxID=4058 RepID=A0ACC0AQL2_CATRO|nr:hypothetical protein M9H77_21561 [Catharanthus roseus]
MILTEMKKVNADATTPLEKLLISLFEKAQIFYVSRSVTCDMMTKEAYLESLSDVKRQFKDIASKDSIEDKHNELQKKLDMLEERKQEVSTSIQRYEEELKKEHIESRSKREKFAAMENAPFQNLMKWRRPASIDLLIPLTSTIVCREIGRGSVLCEKVTKLDDPMLFSYSSLGIFFTILRNLFSELPKNFLFYFVEEELEESSSLEIEG